MHVARVHQMTAQLPIQQHNGVGDVMARTAAQILVHVRKTRQAVARQQLVTVHWVRQRAVVLQAHVQAAIQEAVHIYVTMARGVRTVIAVAPHLHQLTVYVTIHRVMHVALV